MIDLTLPLTRADAPELDAAWFGVLPGMDDPAGRTARLQEAIDTARANGCCRVFLRRGGTQKDLSDKLVTANILGT